MKIVSRIAVMDEGFVAEEGGFEELLARGGKFTALLSGGAWLSSDYKAAEARGANVGLDTCGDSMTIVSPSVLEGSNSGGQTVAARERALQKLAGPTA